MDLYARIEKVSEFLSQENLSQQTISYDPAKTELALVVIDVQKIYCDPEELYGDDGTDAAAGRIAALVPEFRKASIPVYLVHFSSPNNLTADKIDFYKLVPEPSDTLIRKDDVSAFDGSDIDQILKKDGRTKLLVCGVYLDQCVKGTVRDALGKKYEVALLEDMTEDHINDRFYKKATLQRMKDNGVLITKSADVLPLIQREKCKVPSMKAA